MREQLAAIKAAQGLDDDQIADGLAGRISDFKRPSRETVNRWINLGRPAKDPRVATAVEDWYYEVLEHRRTHDPLRSIDDKRREMRGMIDMLTPRQVAKLHADMLQAVAEREDVAGRAAAEASRRAEAAEEEAQRLRTRVKQLESREAQGGSSAATA